MYIPQLDLRGSETSLKSVMHAIRAPEKSWPASLLSRPVISYQVRGSHVALVTDPEAIKTILCSGEQAFPKWLPIYRASATRHTGPNSILAVQGEQWVKIRKTFTPLFAPDKIDLIAENARAGALSATQSLSGIHRLFPLCNRIAIDVMWRTVTGDNAKSPSDIQLQAISDRMVAAFERDDLADAAISISDLAATMSKRMPGPVMSSDHPFRHMTAEGGENKTGLSDAELSDNLFALLYAGQETTALSIAWTLWILGQDQELQDAVRHEVCSVTTNGLFQRESLSRFSLLQGVLKETMRLLPAAMVTVRTNTNALKVAGTELPPDTVLVVPFYALHRSEILWDQPETFRPSRFDPGSPEPRHPMAYIPFSSGRHTCIAAKNSMFEMMAIVATIIRSKRLITHNAESVTLFTHLALRSHQPLLVEFLTV